MKAARTDANHAAIRDDLRRIGCAVTDLSGVGCGCPDLLVGFRGKNYLFEIKDPAKPPSGRKLTDDQVKFHDEWRGQVAVILKIQDAIDILLQRPEGIKQK